MRFKLGGIPDSQDFIPDDTWRPLREPNPWLMQLFALPLGLISFIAIGALWVYATSLSGEIFGSLVSLGVALASFIPLIVVHELIHALIHPKSGRSERSILGFWPSRLLFYAHYDGELTRNRFIAILVMPTVVITLLPLAVAILVDMSCGFLAWISTWNALLACGDMFGVILLLYQVPDHATCRNQGWRTYWKLPENP